MTLPSRRQTAGAVTSDLASRINAEHQAVCEAAQSALLHAKHAGELLIEAKAGLAHGAWLSWLSAYCPTISERRVQGYMRVARSWPELEAKAQRVADLPLRQALALLAEPQETLPDLPIDDDTPPAPWQKNFDLLLGLTRVLVWIRHSKRSRVRREGARGLAELLEWTKDGWDEDVREWVTYCEEMPDFGRAEGEDLLRRLYLEKCEQRIAELEAIWA